MFEKVGQVIKLNKLLNILMYIGFIYLAELCTFFTQEKNNLICKHQWRIV